MSIIDDLRKTIAKAEARILEIQKGCPHPEVSIHLRSIGRNEGNEWRNCTCGLCEAEFTRAMPEKGPPPSTAPLPPSSPLRKGARND